MEIQCISQPEMYRINSMYTMPLPRVSLFSGVDVWLLLSNNEAQHLVIKSRANRIPG